MEINSGENTTEVFTEKKEFEKKEDQGPPGLQMRPCGTVQKAGHATQVCLGLGGRPSLFFDARLYIPQKPNFPKG
jgi:hypothetical protein